MQVITPLGYESGFQPALSSQSRDLNLRIMANETISEIERRFDMSGCSAAG
jgi:hypothetical protein